MRSGSRNAAAALSRLRGGRAKALQAEAATAARARDAAAREATNARNQRELLLNSLPPVEGIPCGRQQFYRRLQLLGVARAAAMEQGIQAAQADTRAEHEAGRARELGQRATEQLRSQQRIDTLQERQLRAEQRRKAQLQEELLQEMGIWLIR